jgi:hypothetical protein
LKLISSPRRMGEVFVGRAYEARIACRGIRLMEEDE